MYLQKKYALSVFAELDHQISHQSLKRYLARHGWKLCYYGRESSHCKHLSQKTSDDTIGEQIIRVADIENYARSVPSFTYQSKDNRAVFINLARKPSSTKIQRLLLHEIGHIKNEHESIDCILGKGNYYLEKEANSFMHYMLQEQRPHSMKEFITFHKVKISFISVLILVLCCLSGFQFLQRPASDDILTSGTSSWEHTENDVPTTANQTPPEHNSADTPENTLPPAIKISPGNQYTYAAGSGVPPSGSPSTVSPSSAPIVHSIQLDDTTIVYVAKTGRVYHLFADCSYIKGHDGVTELPYAYVGNKSLCNTCQKKFLEQQAP